MVRNEFEIGENEPAQALEKELYAAAYLAHPYHHPTIGWRSDIEKVPIEKLKEFYDTFYWPDNATVSVIGDFDPATALGLVKKYYGAFPKAPKAIPTVYTEEPEQTAARRVAVKRAGELGVVAVGIQRTGRNQSRPGAARCSRQHSHFGKEQPLLSRAHRQEPDHERAHGQRIFPRSIARHHLRQSRAGSTHEQVEKIVLDEIERVKKDGVTDAEVAAAIAQSLAASDYGRDGSFAIASVLNEYIAAGDWTLYVNRDDLIKKVTPADVKRVANKYFVEDQKTTGWFIPLKPGRAT